MAFFGRHNNKFYGVGLYLLTIWVLYGRKEVLPRSVIKALNVKDHLKAPKRDPKVAVDYAAVLGGVVSGKTMYQVGVELKKAQKSS